MVFDLAARFLAEFDGIEFDCVGVLGSTVDRRCRFDAAAVAVGDRMALRQWQTDAGCRLCPVGWFLGNEGFQVLLGESGALYVVLIDTLLVAGTDVPSGMNTLCGAGTLAPPASP